MSFKLKDILNEMPRVGAILSPGAIKDLERELFIKITDNQMITRMDHLYDNYYLVHGLNSIVEMWCSIIEKIDDKFNLVFISKLDQIGSLPTKNLTVFKVRQSKKLDITFKDCYFHSYINLCKFHQCSIVCDKDVSSSAAGSWIKLLDRNDLEKNGVKQIVINFDTREEIEDYGKVGKYFLNTDKTRKFVCGIQPI